MGLTLWSSLGLFMIMDKHFEFTPTLMALQCGINVYPFKMQSNNLFHMLRALYVG